MSIMCRSAIALPMEYIDFYLFEVFVEWAFSCVCICHFSSLLSLNCSSIELVVVGIIRIDMSHNVTLFSLHLSLFLSILILWLVGASALPITCFSNATMKYTFEFFSLFVKIVLFLFFDCVLYKQRRFTWKWIKKRPVHGPCVWAQQSTSYDKGNPKDDAKETTNK